MRFRSTIVAGILLLLVLQGSSAAEQRPVHAKYARPLFSAVRNPAQMPLPWEVSQAFPRVTAGTTTEEDRNWGTEFGLPIPNGAVRSVAFFNGSLIIGGDFTHIGGVRVGHIARWSGTEWLPLGGGLDAPATALLANGTDLFVGGSFRHAGSVLAQGVARWDGSTWWAVGADIVDPGGNFGGVRSLMFYHDELVAGGDFESSTYPYFRGVARFNGAVWSPVGDGVHGVVTAIAVFRDSLYVAGEFDIAGSTPAANIARWYGSEWASLGSGLTSGAPTTMTVYTDRLFVGGDFREAGGLETPFFAAWNGLEWLPMNGPNFLSFLSVTSLAVHQGKLYVADQSTFGLTAWDGSAWSGVTDFVGSCMAMASDGTDLFVAGSFSSFPDKRAVNIGRWDGAVMHGFETWDANTNGLAFSVLSSAYPAGVTSLTSYRGDLLATGLITLFGSSSGWGEVDRAIPAWSGSSWRLFDSTYPLFEPIPPWWSFAPTPLHAAGGSLYLGGQFLGQDGLPHAVLEFDGSSWSALDTLSGSARAITTVDGRLYVAVDPLFEYGCDPSGPAPSNSSIFEWQNGRWDEIASTTPGVAGTLWCSAPIVRLSEYQGDLVAYGGFDAIGGALAKGIARWNGSSWQAFGSGPSGQLFPFTGGAVVGDRLIVPTFADSQDGLVNSMLETWDGTSWSVLPGIRGNITCIAGIGGVLYVGGVLELDGVAGKVSVASWGGLQWTTFGSGLGGPPTAIVEHDGAIYFGGGFSTAGDKSSFGVARWDAPRRAPQLRTPQLSPARPNPFRGVADLSLQLDGEGIVRVAVYDINGREVTVLEDGFRNAGPHGIRWDGRDRLGKQVPAGVYFISAKGANGATTSRKVVRLR